VRCRGRDLPWSGSGVLAAAHRLSALSPALAPLRRVALLTGTVIVSTLLGMVLVFGYGLAHQARPLAEQASAEPQEA